MTLRLTPEETEALRRTAAREHRSMQEVARSAVVGYVGGTRVVPLMGDRLSGVASVSMPDPRS